MTHRGVQEEQGDPSVLPGSGVPAEGLPLPSSLQACAAGMRLRLTPTTCPRTPPGPCLPTAEPLCGSSGSRDPCTGLGRDQQSEAIQGKGRGLGTAGRALTLWQGP